MFFCFRLLLFLGIFTSDHSLFPLVRASVMEGCDVCAPVYYRCITVVFENDEAARVLLRRARCPAQQSGLS